MATKRLYYFLIALIGIILFLQPVSAQLAKNSQWVKTYQHLYDVQHNIVYDAIDSNSTRLDLYVPKKAEKPTPVLMWIHGGGWGRLSKDSVSGQLIPYLGMGWAVINVDYRLTSVALAPAAVQDCRSALRWLVANAKILNIDTKKIVLSGTSAGGHLALMTGMLPSQIPYDTLGIPVGELSVAAIVNFYGITDVNDLMALANRKGYAVNWIGDQPNKEEIARAVSPLTYVRKGLPPILSIQGDADPTVPYTHSVRLHEALEKAGVPNQLMTIPGGKHGRFTKEENLEIEKVIKAFLLRHKIL